MKKKILIVDDQISVVKIVSDVLKKGDYEIITAANGQLGIDSAKENKPDLIIMDIMMPVKTGLEAIQEIKEMDDIKSIPILVLTAKGGGNDLETAMNLGASGFLSKPFSPRAILEEVDRLLSL